MPTEYSESCSSSSDNVRSTVSGTSSFVSLPDINISGLFEPSFANSPDAVSNGDEFSETADSEQHDETESVETTYQSVLSEVSSVESYHLTLHHELPTRGSESSVINLSGLFEAADKANGNQQNAEDAISEIDHVFEISDDSSLFSESYSSSYQFDLRHKCLNFEDDPFVGILRTEAAVMMCCPLRSFLLMSPDNEGAYTTYGKKLLEVCQAEELDLRDALIDPWSWNWEQAMPSLRHFLESSIEPYRDSDGVKWTFGSCSICFSEYRFVRIRKCCGKTACQPCWQSYVKGIANTSMAVHLTGTYELYCFACPKIVPFSEALGSTEPEDLLLIRPPGHYSCATSRCPICLKPPPPIVVAKGRFSSQTKVLTKHQKKRGGKPVTCDRCQTRFCTACGILEHPNISCKQLLESDGLKRWANKKNSSRPEFQNGRRCPKCKVMVAHNGGCPHMTCPCGAEFCYACGQKYFSGLNFFATSHTGNRYIPFVSCAKMWNSTPKRLAVHSLVGFGMTTAALVAAPIVLPVIGIVALVRKCR